MTHSVKRRSPGNNYRNPGFYHVTINVHDRKNQLLGRVIGDLQCPDGHPHPPRVIGGRNKICKTGGTFQKISYLCGQIDK